MDIGATIQQSLKEGDLTAAFEHAKDLVRKDPACAKPRILLFQLFCVLGDWDRALTQLKMAGDLTADALPMLCTYREVLPSEAVRARVFTGHQTPVVFGKPEGWIALLMMALRLDAQGHADDAARLRAQAFDDAPATAGTIDGSPFAWIADGDQRLGPILEAVVNGRYLWIPLHRVRAIDVEPPTDLRDCVWTGATVTFVNGGEAAALIPTRYPGTTDAADPLLKLARKTEWVERPGNLVVGLGQRMVVTDAGDYALMDVRRIELDVAETRAHPVTEPAEPGHG